MKKSLSSLLLSALCLFTAPLSSENWPRFLGPDGLSTSSETGLTHKWGDKDIQWNTQLPGVGQSSPIIWNDRIYLTSSSEDETQRFVYSLEKATGKLLWTYEFKTDQKEKRHRLNSPATASCATNGDYIVAFFGASGLHCLDKKGKKVWSKNLGSFPGFFGTAASPIILDNKVIQNCDAAGESYLVAFDLKTGNEIWKTKRLDKPKGGWATPTLIDTGKRQELILNGEFGPKSYNPDNGEEYWRSSSFNGRGSPSPAFDGKNLYFLNGKPGDAYAITPNGSGNVTQSHMAWHTERGRGRDLPSPVLASGQLFTVNMKGNTISYNPKDGKELWAGDLARGNYVASPLVVDGHIYVIGDTGKISVIKPGTKLDVAFENVITPKDREVFRSQLVVDQQKFYLRSSHRLYCIAPQ